MCQSKKKQFSSPHLFTGQIIEGKRMSEGRKMLSGFSAGGDFKVANMMDILRNEESGICRGKGETKN